MLVDPSMDRLCERVETSVSRVVYIRGFSCNEENGKLVLRGEATTRDDAIMCLAVARSVPGASSVVNRVKVAK